MKYGWETRRKGEATTIYLGRVLEGYLGLKAMAKRAREGHFDDYFAPEEVADGLEILRLYGELADKQAILQDSPQRRRIGEVMEAIKQGEFDGTPAESKRWAASKSGQDAMRALMRGDLDG